MFICLFSSKRFDTSNGIFPHIHPVNGTQIQSNGYWRQYRKCYKPFNWSKPNGLNEKTEKLFWKQKENFRHFRDTNNTEHCGIIRFIANGQAFLPFPVISNVTHFINTRIPPAKTLSPKNDMLLLLSGHWGHYFQHFFDNIGPQIALAYDVFGNDFSDVNAVVDVDRYLFPVVPKLWKQIGFRKVIESEKNAVYSAQSLFMIESCPRVHPDFYVTLRNLLHLKLRLPPTKIIWISRSQDNSYYQQRFVLNEKDVIKMLKRIYGAKNVVAFNHKQYSFVQTKKLFAQAKAIIGSHGGGFYNQFYAPNSTTIIEILPVKSNGLYHDQRNADETPSFSHMAVWSNSILIGQQFWRYYQISTASNFEVNLEEFKEFLLQIKSLEPQDFDLEDL